MYRAGSPDVHLCWRVPAKARAQPGRVGVVVRDCETGVEVVRHARYSAAIPPVVNFACETGPACLGVFCCADHQHPDGLSLPAANANPAFRAFGLTMTDVWLPRRLVHAPFQLLAPGDAQDAGVDANADVDTIPLRAYTTHPTVKISALLKDSPGLGTPHSDYAAHAASAVAPATSLLAPDAPPVVLARALEDATLLELRWVHSRLLSSVPEEPDSDPSAWHIPAPCPPAARLFRFEAPLLPGMAVFFDTPSATLQVLAVTITGYLYRLTFASPDYFHVDRLSPDAVSEYPIRAFGVIDQYGQIYSARPPEQVHVVGPGLVLVTRADGSIIRLEQARSYTSFSGFECTLPHILRLCVAIHSLT